MLFSITFYILNLFIGGFIQANEVSQTEETITISHKLISEMKELMEKLNGFSLNINGAETKSQYNDVRIKISSYLQETVNPEERYLEETLNKNLQQQNAEMTEIADYVKATAGYEGEESSEHYLNIFLKTDEGKNVKILLRQALGNEKAKGTTLTEDQVYKILLATFKGAAVTTELQKIKAQYEAEKAAAAKAAEEKKIAEEAAATAEKEAAAKALVESNKNEFKLEYDLTNTACPSGFTKYLDKYCFKTTAVVKTNVLGDLKRCVEAGGFLFGRNREIAAKNMVDFPKTNMNSALNDIVKERCRSRDEWQNSDGTLEDIPREKWFSQPSCSFGENCIAVDATGRTNDADCGFVRTSSTVCEWNPYRGTVNEDFAKWTSMGVDATRGWVSPKFGDYWSIKSTGVVKPEDCLKKCTAGKYYCISFYHSALEQICYANIYVDALLPKDTVLVNDFVKYIPTTIYNFNKNN